MFRFSPELKETARRLVEAAHSEPGVPWQRLREVLNVVSDEVLDAPKAMPEGPRRIGIWEPRQLNGELRFVRPAEPCEQASLWAATGCIDPKGRRKRVVLIGESVARGFFFDPHFNPAMVLQYMLREAAGEREIEVVDLARTDLTRVQLLELVEQAVQLSPDAVVVLAGNNWQPTVGLAPQFFRELADRLRDGDWSDVKAHLENLLREQTRSTIQTLCHLAQQHRFKLVFALPEFNLVDWRTTAVNPPLLATDATAEWRKLRVEADRAASVGDTATVEALGRRLIALDKGTTGVGFNLIADAKVRAGDFTEARRNLELARDTAVCLPNGPESPRCFTAIQEVLRAEAAKGRLMLVDLPCTFHDQLSGGLPDRRLFLDYCHFNVDGTHLAMAAVAQAVLTSLYKLRRSCNELTSLTVAVDPRVEGEAYFLAAIHNANWGQSAELVRQHCARALKLAPSLSEMMELFLDFHVRRAPASLCHSFHKLCHSRSASAVSLLFDSARPTADKFLNPILIDAILDALETRQGAGARSVTEQRLSTEHGIDRQGVSLLNLAYSSESYLVPLNSSGFSFYRASECVSRFRLSCSQPQPIQLSLTYRTRGCAAGEICVSIRGQFVGRAPASNTWTTANFLVPRDCVHSGSNLVEVVWPPPVWDLSKWKNEVATELQRAHMVETNPVFGEIHELRAVVKRTKEYQFVPPR